MHDLLSMHTGTVPVQFPVSHVLVAFPSSLNPSSQVYVAAVPFGLVPLNTSSSILYSKVPLPISRRSEQKATIMTKYVLVLILEVRARVLSYIYFPTVA